MSSLPDHLRTVTDEEEADIQRQIAADPEDEELSDEAAKKPMSFFEAHKRGRPTLQISKQQISIRLDPDIIEHYRATGKSWQSKINDDLRKAAGLKG
ncbi:hypothetical protein BJF93_01200 [Xaviernesmea oryzae]|uniref:BrnA antitoxin family protein n=1 Tax=Xaviernesmea oryzae TaxID=464029 RepID=A0A1Q9B259_9HYPH|nr:BrnA antitoxin family protein [Xaviernesmea oryzae]OLP62099.1 hypothetical protein BJF93_01200 [Xaviernesmea oryzae]SEL87313.1 Uncharacterized conserved protein, DUF4415 family [Xaviernesmea oryzae]